MTTLKVMTWNVENFFRPALNAPQAEVDRYQQKLALLADVINQQNPDVIALQETGGLEPLQDLQEALGGTFPRCVVSAFPDGRGIRVAFLSQIPVSGQADIVDFPSGPALDIHNITPTGDSLPVRRMGRGALWIRVTKNGRPFHLITAHLKSKLLSYPRVGGSSFTPRDETERAQVAGIALMRRMAEAVTLRLQANMLLSGNDQTPLLLMGDFNDVPDAQTSLLLTGPSGSEIGTVGFNRPDKGDDVRLFNLAPLIPEARRYSRITNGRPELLDQIFASEEFFPVEANNKRRLPLVDSLIDFTSQLPSVGDNPTVRDTATAPDHAPVVAMFALGV
ncbi:MAG: endonuclease/exonuclease/phosphatase family protein [Anaerolineales bacterium]|nr:endonuclease/exonuclease/phosphatase family protein [Anaerolineales bacterium]